MTARGVRLLWVVAALAVLMGLGVGVVRVLEATQAPRYDGILLPSGGNPAP